MYDFIYQTVSSFKYVGIVVLMAIFSTEAVMPFVGYKASEGALLLPVAILVGIVGSTLNSIVVYFLARRLSPGSLSKFADKHGKWIGITGKGTDRAGRMFDRHQRATVFFGRFIPGLRTAVSVPAGYRRMYIAPFLFYTVLGHAISSTSLALLGYYAQANVANLQSMAVAVTYMVAACIICACLLYAFVRYCNKKHKDEVL